VYTINCIHDTIQFTAVEKKNEIYKLIYFQSLNSTVDTIERLSQVAAYGMQEDSTHVLTHMYYHTSIMRKCQVFFTALGSNVDYVEMQVKNSS